MKFADVKNDIAFRKIFGNENKRIILISFLNAVMRLKAGQRIVAIEMMNPYQPPIILNFKASIIDVKARDEQGRTFIIEMQVAELEGLDKRLLYYVSKDYAQQIHRGEEYEKLTPVIFIGIFDFHFTQGPEYLSHHAVCNVETRERVINDFDFYFIELPKFKKGIEEIAEITDKWIYFLKEADNLTVIPGNVDDDGLKAAYEDANWYTWTKEEHNAYDYASMREQDERGRMKLAVRRATEKATKEALEKGMEKGMEKGVVQGLLQKEIDAVVGMAENGIPIPVIAKSLKISEDRVREILREAGTLPD